MRSGARGPAAVGLWCCSALLAGGCGRPAPTASPTPSLPPPLPPLTVEHTAPQPRASTTAPEDPLSRLRSGRRVTLAARDVDVRALLAALAEAAGVSLVVEPGIQGRISVNLVDVPAAVAFREVMAAAGLSLAAGPPPPPWGPVVFYVLPVDIERASVELIQARFGVSREVAEWIVQNQRPRS